MEQEQEIDVANEPVDKNIKSGFMDTGVLHEGRTCITCDKPAVKGAALCASCGEKAAEFLANSEKAAREQQARRDA